MPCKALKIPYLAEEDAWRAALNGTRCGRFKDMYIYFCKGCGAWHLKTAKVQIHDWLWFTEHRPKRVWLWFKHREKEVAEQRQNSAVSSV
jgi:hypothetical protein